MSRDRLLDILDPVCRASYIPIAVRSAPLGQDPENRFPLNGSAYHTGAVELQELRARSIGMARIFLKKTVFGQDSGPQWFEDVRSSDRGFEDPRMRGETVKLSTKGRYAVMAMVDLACNAEGGPVALADIASRQEISLSYLEQLFGKLRKGGLVRSVRGPGGGYLLSRPAGQLRISDIILAVDEPIQTTRCAPGSPAGCHHHKGRCLTHDLWEELGNQIYLYLSAVSLGDVIERRLLGSSGIFHSGGERIAAAQ